MALPLNRDILWTGIIKIFLFRFTSFNLSSRYTVVMKDTRTDPEIRFQVNKNGIVSRYVLKKKGKKGEGV